MIHEENGDTFNLNNWEIIDEKGKVLKITQCGGLKILGGYGELST